MGQSKNQVKQTSLKEKIKTEGTERNMPSSYKEALVQFCHSTTVHGLRFLVPVGQKWIQLFWFTIILTGFVGLSIHLYNIICAYLQYKTTEYSYERGTGYSFPDVTVCNWNGISATNLEAVAKELEEAKHYLDEVKKPDVSLTPQNLFWVLGENASKVGHSLTDFVLRCRFQGQLCNLSKDFVLFQFSNVFNCFTFVVGRFGKKSITQGIAAGLSLTLFLEPTPEMYNVYEEKLIAGNVEGVRVVITAPNTLPAVGVMGYDILPGHATSIGFDITEHKRLPEPYSNCRGVDSMALEGNLSYSFTECKNMCLHKMVIDKCGCFPTKLVVRSYNYLTVNSCGQDLFQDVSKTKALLECQTSVLHKSETGLDYGKECNCYVPCEETKYPVTVSQSLFPSQSRVTSFLKLVLEDHLDRENLKAYQMYQNLIQQNVSKEFIKSWTRKHFLRLNVYANSKTVAVKEEIPMYTLVDFMSQIGGCLGLWLGISIITVVEFFDLGLKLMYLLLQRSTQVTKIKIKEVQPYSKPDKLRY